MLSLLTHFFEHPQEWIPPHTTLFVRKSVFESCGLYDTSFRVSGDYDLMLRMLKSGNHKLHCIPEVFVLMQTGGLSSKNYLQIIKEDYAAVKNNGLGGVSTLVYKYLRVFTQYSGVYRTRT